MTTPQYKFFDTVNKVFPENQDEYFINNMGVILFSNFYSTDAMARHSMDVAKNIIAVPFTGFYDNHNKPIYSEDIVKYMGYIGLIRKHEKYNFYRFESSEMIEVEWDIYSPNPEGLLIIGSILTNPELLENKL